MRTLAVKEIENVNGALLARFLIEWAAGETLDWLVHGGGEWLMTGYGNAVSNGNGLPGESSGGVAV